MRLKLIDIAYSTWKEQAVEILAILHLLLPDGTVSAGRVDDYLHEKVRLKFEHESFDELYPGEDIPTFQIMMQDADDGFISYQLVDRPPPDPDSLKGIQDMLDDWFD